MKLYFIGICGSGMCPLALFMKKKGHHVSGSDHSNGLNKSRLKDSGIAVFSEHSKENIIDFDQVIYSSAIADDNAEMISAKEQGIPVKHRSDLLSELCNQHKYSIAVAGTHGKTTTTSMIAHILSELKLEPNAIVGAVFSSKNTDHMVGDSEYFVFEADESDGSIVKYSPFISVVTNIAWDHTDHFKSFEDVKICFKEFLLNTSSEGYCVLNWDQKELREFFKDLNFSNQYTTGHTIGCDLRFLSYTNNDDFILSFDAISCKDRFIQNLNLMGEHNVMNALSALTAVMHLDFDIETCADALSSFDGVKRRLEFLNRGPQKILIDDYAHNPDKIYAAVKTIKEYYKEKNLTIIFEPHRYSRIQSLAGAFRESLSLADEVFVAPVFSAGEPKPNGFEIESLLGEGFNYFYDIDELYHSAIHSNSAIILTLGAGSIGKLAEKINKYFS